MKKIFFSITVLFTLVSCNDYLDIEPKGQVLPSSIEDYQLLLNKIRVHESLKEELSLSCDDFSFSESSLGELNDPNNSVLQLYTFSEKRHSNPGIASQTWNDLYSNIYVYNKVIAEIDKADITLSHGEEERLIVKGNAYFNRALNYFYLVNVYAKHYSSNSANSPGIPLVLKADVSQKIENNNTIQEVYNLIESDLKIAVNFLGQNKDNVKVGKGAAYALLSRVNLYKSNYQLALDNAKLALGYNGILNNYTSAMSGDEVAIMLSNERYADIYVTYPRFRTSISSSVAALFETTDTRSTFLQMPGWAYPGLNMFSWAVKISSLPTVGEMYLTIAECEARIGSKEKAITKLNDIRKNRIILVQDKMSSDFSNDTALLKFILEERRRELLTSTIRLFELKRLNLEPEFQTTFSRVISIAPIEINGVITPQPSIEYNITPNSGQLVIPIPANVKQFNKGL